MYRTQLSRWLGVVTFSGLQFVVQLRLKKHTAIKSTINIYYEQRVENEKRYIFVRIHPLLTEMLLFRRGLLSGGCEYTEGGFLMENNNNLLSFGLRCGDSVTFLFVPPRERYMEMEAKMGEPANICCAHTHCTSKSHLSPLQTWIPINRRNLI